MDNLPDRGKGRAKAWLLAHVAYAGDDCLQWPMSRDTHGYGQLGMAGGRVRKAHRVMCEMAHGEPPSPKHEAAHSCGNGHLGCINPKHLLWKTRSENQLDRRRHGSQLGHPYGNKGKLSRTDVLAIRAMRGIKPETELGKMFGVSPTTINKIHNRKRQASIR